MNGLKGFIEGDVQSSGTVLTREMFNAAMKKLREQPSRPVGYWIAVDGREVYTEDLTRVREFFADLWRKAFD